MKSWLFGFIATGEHWQHGCAPVEQEGRRAIIKQTLKGLGQQQPAPYTGIAKGEFL